MKKILFVCNGLYGGGAERVVARLSNFFVNEGHMVSIAASKTDRRYDIDRSIIIRQIEGGYLQIVKSLRSIVHELRPDVIIAMGTFYNYCSILSKTKESVVICSERTDPAVSGKGFVKRHFRNYIYQYADRLVFQTPDALAYFPARIRNKGTIIPNPISNDLPDRIVKGRRKTIVNFCRLTQAKNLPLLLDSFMDFHKDHQSYSLHIYGDGPLKENLLNDLVNRDMEDIVTLHPNQENILDVIKDSAMFVSSSSFEGLSNSMLEAMAIGLPTICTDCPCGGARMMINDKKNGLLVPNGDRKALANAMALVAENPQFAEQLSENAIKIRETLSISRIANMWEQLF